MTEDEARVRLRWLAQAGLAKQVEEDGEARYHATGLGFVDLARQACRMPVGSAEFARDP